MEHRLKLAALFLLSVALIAFELGIMRVFSVGSWSNFGNLIISTALLGFGISGAILTFATRSVEKHANSWLFWTSLLFSLSMPLTQIVTQYIPFEPTFLGSDPAQVLWIGVYYLIYGVSFVCGASFIGVCFVALKGQVRQLYFWNMAGSGAGGFFIIVCMYLLPPSQLVLPVMGLSLVACILVMLKPDSLGKFAVSTTRFGVVVVTALVAVAALINFGQIRVSEYKSISYAYKYPELIERHHSWSPEGDLQVFQSKYFHFAPGLSDNASLHPDSVPNQAFWAMYLDGSGPVGIMGSLDSKTAGYVDYLPMAAPYEVLENPKVLLVHLGGGINAQVAKYKGASEVTIAEQDPELIKLMRDDPAVSGFTGKMLEDPIIDLREVDARAWAKSNPESYNMVEISLIDSIGLSDSGGYSVRENYTYTAEAISDYLTGLHDGGILSITVWNNLSPPRNVLKLLSTIIQSLKESGVSDPGKRLFMFDQLRSTATILVKKGDFSDIEIAALRHFVERNSFNMIYHPGIEPVSKDLYTLVDAYRSRFVDPQKEVDSDFNPSEIYQLSILEMLAGKLDALEKAYVFDIRPMRDDRPFYSGYLKLDEIGMYLDHISEISEEWGYLLQLGVLVQAVFFGLLVVAVPVLGRWRGVFKKQKGKMGVIVYFASLGMSYMLVEIFLIQRLVVFLGNPIFSVSIVITAMLIVSGIGNLLSPKLAKTRTVRVRIAVIGIVASALFYIFGLGPVLEIFQNAPMLARILIAIVLIAPAAFFMGIPYPNGLEALTENRPSLLPWAWGMNGGLSVAGTALAYILSVATGFVVLLIAVIVLYAIVALIFPVNELRSQDAA